MKNCHKLPYLILNRSTENKVKNKPYLKRNHASAYINPTEVNLEKINFQCTGNSQKFQNAKEK